jgi:hypothetical protein
MISTARDSQLSCAVRAGLPASTVQDWTEELRQRLLKVRVSSCSRRST